MTVCGRSSTSPGGEGLIAGTFENKLVGPGIPVSNSQLGPKEFCLHFHVSLNFYVCLCFLFLYLMYS